MSAELQFQINNQNVSAPLNWQDIQIEANFINKSEETLVQSLQPNLTIEKFTFVNEAAKIIRDYVDGGKDLSTTGIFEGLPFKITAFDAQRNQVVFDGILDLTDDYVEVSSVRVECKIKRIDGLNTFSDRAEAVSYGFLNSDKIKGLTGGIPDSLFENLSYVVEKKLEPEKLFMAQIVAFLLVKELAESIKDLVTAIQNVFATATGGLSGPAASLGQALALALIQLAYVAVLVIAVIKMVQQMVALLISPVRQHKVIKLKIMLEKAAEYLGYGFDSPIDELNFLRYLPSKPDEDESVAKGIPNPDDFGYYIDQAYNIAKDCFNAKAVILNGVVVLRSLNDPFWEQQSTYKMVDLDLEIKRRNTDEMFRSRLVEFETDTQDWWTSNNKKGTYYEVIANEIKRDIVTNTQLKGVDIIAPGVALGNDKDGLNALEKAIREVASAADALVKVFGKASNLADKVTARIGMLKQSDNVHSVPKLIYLVNGKIPPNHRDKFGAKAMYDKYINERSFVANNFGGQYERYKDIKVPFGFANFIEVLNSSIFQTWDQRTGRIESVRWTMGSDFANMDFRIKEIYTKNLEEITVEPE